MQAIVPRQTVLVTGGGGFLGANLLRRLVAENLQVHLIWKPTTNPWRINEIIDKLNLHRVDLSDKGTLTRLVKRIKPGAIFHLAAHGAYETQTDIEQMMEVTIRGTVNLLSSTLDIPYSIFVNTGSSAEYGWKKQPMKESDLLSPNSFYAATKASASLLCQVFALRYHKPIVSLRPFSVYGPHEEPGRFIPTAIVRALANQPIKLTPTTVRHDFVYIDDVIAAYMATLVYAKALSGKIVNVGSGIQHTNLAVAKKILKLTASKSVIDIGGFAHRAWDSPFWQADIALAQKLLAWSPKYSLEAGLSRTIDWIKQHPARYHEGKT